MVAIEDVNQGGAKPIPRLEITEQLANNLRTLYGDSCDAFIGLQATKSRFLEQVTQKNRDYSSIVSATHGDISNKAAWLLEPVLYLTMASQKMDGLLTMSEVANLKLDTDIAALTACKTGLGENSGRRGGYEYGKGVSVRRGQNSINESLGQWRTSRP